jgi:hypothetical protein
VAERVWGPWVVKNAVDKQGCALVFGTCMSSDEGLGQVKVRPRLVVGGYYN